MIEIMQKVIAQEVNGKELPTDKRVYIGVKSHWKFNELVIIKTSRGHTVTVAGEHLIKAVNNAMNT